MLLRIKRLQRSCHERSFIDVSATNGATRGASLKGRDFIELSDYTPDEIRYLLDLAIELKRKVKAGETFHPLKGKTLGMIFEKVFNAYARFLRGWHVPARRPCAVPKPR